ncbi:hypothetical protein CCPUN_09330 [Cardinium endosymbiont of Culicoides punctatus]|nr:hypothetical protein CCPUN_09330 [Cardinium endosymbiont of Culicoides punctatus]
MLNRIIKLLCKLFGSVYIAEKVREKLIVSISEFQDTMREKIKKMGPIFALVAVIFLLFSLGLRFLLSGLAYWLNAILNSSCLGFFIISILCFVIVAFAVYILHKRTNH